jgi:hypothetical protein
MATESESKVPEVKSREFVTYSLTLIMEANVLWVRSFDHHVYLMATTGHNGWAYIGDPYAFAIMAAAQAAGRTVFAAHGKHDPNWGNGAGLWENVTRVALQREAF